MEQNLLNDPIAQFKLWLAQAEASEINDPGAMALATCSKDGKPSVRMVLLKQVDENGFKFHTNVNSQKGKALKETPYGSVCFYWKSLRKQVRVDGQVKIIDGKEADAYFAERPYKRQIGAWASQQSSPLDSRATLENKIKTFEQQYPEGSVVPRPESWVGFRLLPDTIEFWMDNPDRLHDRFLYTHQSNGTWDITRLYP